MPKKSLEEQVNNPIVENQKETTFTVGREIPDVFLQDKYSIFLVEDDLDPPFDDYAGLLSEYKMLDMYLFIGLQFSNGRRH